MKEAEEWRDIPDTNGLYQASNFGRIRSLNPFRCNRIGSVMKPAVGRGGYLRLGIIYPNKGKTLRNIHHLVAEAFIGSRPNGMVVNHIDFDRTNNHIDNLEYVTVKENIRHSQERRTKALRESPNLVHYKGDDHWTRRTPERLARGEKQGSAKMTEAQVADLKERYRKGMTPMEAIRELGISHNIAYRIKQGRSWVHVP